MSGAVPGSPGDGERFGSPQWSDNVGRMHQFMKAHPEVKITVPSANGTKDFIATWPEDGKPVEARDRSLGWLMDHLEGLFKEDPDPGTVTP